MKNEYRTMELILWLVVVLMIAGLVGIFWWAIA